MKRLILHALIALLACPLAATAQKYPERPIRVILPFAAGSGTDIFARILLEELRKINYDPTRDYASFDRLGTNR